MTDIVQKAEQKAEEIRQGYGADDVPVFSYALLMGTYAAVFAGLYRFATRNGRPLERPRGGDFALLAVASYKLSRIVTMSFIGSPLRAAFAERGPSLKGGEVQDKARGQGLQRAVGNLVTCPFCFSVWSTTFVVFGYSIARRATLQASTILSIAAVDDFLNLGFRNLREQSR